jgi:phosphoserine aminotransferase
MNRQASSATKRLINFSAGPAVLPVEVLEEVRDNLLSLGDTGIGIMECSHRSKPFEDVLNAAERDCRELLNLPDNYAILFLQGGASTQFFHIPMNFMTGEAANYIDTGVWASKAIKEAKLFGDVHVAASGEAENYARLPKEFNWSDRGVYTHYTSNNTIYGTEFKRVPESPAPLICDASSNIMSGPMEPAKHVLIYAGAQKNLGPSGVTLVIIDKEFAERGGKNLPTMVQYRTHIKDNSLYNTPNTFGIFVMNRVFAWMKRQGGLEAIGKRNAEKAKALYDYLDSSAFWKAPVAQEDRSNMNVVFRLATEDLEKKLVNETEKAGLSGLKGHRSAGGLRASLYNAFTLEHVHELVAFLKEFERRNG